MDRGKRRAGRGLGRSDTFSMRGQGKIVSLRRPGTGLSTVTGGPPVFGPAMV